MGRCAPFDPYHSDPNSPHPSLENEAWAAFESHFIHQLLQGRDKGEASTELLKKLHELWPWPNLLFLQSPHPETRCVGLPAHLCSRQTGEWLDNEWPRIQRVYQRPDWQFNESAHCLSGVWKTFIEKIANPLLDSAWVEPVKDADGEMCGVLVLFMPHRAWFDPTRIAYQRRAACLAGYLTGDRTGSVHETFVHTLAKAGHALRSPLNAIIGYGELAAKKLHDMIAEVLDVAALLSSTLPLQPMPFSPIEVLRRIESEVRPAIENKGNRLSIHTEGEDHPFTQDKNHLHRLLVQLLSNANHWTENGTIHIRAEWNEKTLTLAIQDAGPGLTPHQRTALEAGLPVPLRESDEERRLGMGLMLAKHLAQHLRGRLTYRETEKGKGFAIELPNLAAEAPAWG